MTLPYLLLRRRRDIEKGHIPTLLPAEKSLAILRHIHIDNTDKGTI